MSYISLEELSKNCKSYYKLVLVAAERANELLEGERPLIETTSKKHTTIALDEVRKEKIKTNYKD